MAGGEGGQSHPSPPSHCFHSLFKSMGWFLKEAF
jgi:hypothetical protein